MNKHISVYFYTLKIDPGTLSKLRMEAKYWRFLCHYDKMLEIGWIPCFLSGMLFQLGDLVISFFTSLTSLIWFIDGIIPQSSVLAQGQWTILSSLSHFSKDTLHLPQARRCSITRWNLVIVNSGWIQGKSPLSIEHLLCSLECIHLVLGSRSDLQLFINVYINFLDMSETCAGFLVWLVPLSSVTLYSQPSAISSLASLDPCPPS